LLDNAFMRLPPTWLSRSWVCVCARDAYGVLGLMWVEPMFMAVSLATSLCTRMVLISPSATHGQADGAVRAVAVLSWC
jgi:hypothetical protein